MIKEVRLLYVPFKYFVSGHVSFVFKLINGEEIVISPEAKTDKFILLLGFTPFYRLHYRIDTFSKFYAEIAQKNRRIHDTKLALDSSEANLLYRHVIDRMNELQEGHVKYHTLFNSCITNVQNHLDQVKPSKIRFLSLFSPVRPQLLVREYYE